MSRMVGLVAPGVGGETQPPDAALPSFVHLVGAPNALRAQAGDGDDAWGIGWFDAAGQVSLVRQTGSALDSAFYVFAAEGASRGGAGSGPATILIGHLRNGATGAAASENAHPVRVDYPGGEADPLRPYETLLAAVQGALPPDLLRTLREDLGGERDEARSDSDAVVLAAWLSQWVAERTHFREDLADALRALLGRAAAGSAAPPMALNLLVAHRSGLYALRFSAAGAENSLSARRGDAGEGAAWVVASEPTDGAPGWEPLPHGMLVWLMPDGNVRTAPVT